MYVKQLINPKAHLRIYLLSTNLSNVDFKEHVDIKKPDNESYPIKVNYDSVKTHRLPSPYQTKCVDYSSRRSVDNCWSQESCFDQCVENLLIKKSGQLYKEKLHDPNAISSSFRNMSYATYETDTFRKVCQEIVSGPDCDTMEYFRYIANTDTKFKNFKNFVTLVVAPSYVPLINIVHQESITLVDFLIYVLGTLSFWLCLSPFNNMIAIYELSNKKINRQTSNRIQSIDCVDCGRLSRRVDSMKVQIDQQKNFITLQQNDIKLIKSTLKNREQQIATIYSLLNNKK